MILNIFSARSVFLRAGLILALLWPPLTGLLLKADSIEYLSASTLGQTSNSPWGLIQPYKSAIATTQSQPTLLDEWTLKVQKDILQSEYRVTWQDQTNLPDLASSFQAPNRAQNLRTYFSSEGIRIIPRTDTLQAQNMPAWEWGLSLKSYGFGQDLRPVGAADLVPTNNRIEYQRGNIVEWYLNEERGLEQGFTIKQSPASIEAGAAESEDLVLRMAFLGNLVPSLAADGKTLAFSTTGGVSVLRYGDLYTTDAAGRILPSRFEMVTQSEQETPELLIIVDAKDAVYPVTIDPLATSADWTAESNADTAKLGFSVRTVGDVNGDGYSDIIVGAPYFDGGEADEGKVFLFLGSASGLSVASDWSVESDQPGASLGFSAGTAGDVDGDGYSDVVIGAPYYSNVEANEGKVFVYFGSSTGLSVSADWTAESDLAGASFGYSVGTAGDIDGDGFSDIIIGAPDFTNGEANEGKAFVYHGSASGPGALDWSIEGGLAGAKFGSSVGTAGDVTSDGYDDVIVGAPYFANGQLDEGKANMYFGSSSGLNVVPDWSVEGNLAGANFGASVGTAGDINGDGYCDLVVGAPGFMDTLSNEGSVNVFYGSSEGIGGSPDWWAYGGQTDARLGTSAIAAGDVNSDGYSDLLVGAPYFANGQANEGKAYLYFGSSSGLNATPPWTFESDLDGANLGFSVGPAGDVNGDGFSDIIIGAPGYDNVQTDEGRAYVFLGSASNMRATANWTADTVQGTDYYSWSVASAGDINGDGFDDVIVGAPFYANGQINEGAAYLYLGASSGLNVSSSWSVEGNLAKANYGYSVATAGDVNGDGYSDVLVGAPFSDLAQPGYGRVFLYYGSPTGLNTAADWTVINNQTTGRFGFSVATAGDVNGDGYSDVIIGAPSYANGEAKEGRTYVYLGSAFGLSTTPIWTAESNRTNAEFGWSVSTAGDVNGDGFSDVLIGAPDYDNGASVREGRAYVYLGSSAGLNATAVWEGSCNQRNANYGYSVSTAGDVNGDGYSDIVVGVPFWDNGQLYEGKAYVYQGSSSGPGVSAAWAVESDQVDARFGQAVSLAGDVNGDGYSDILVTAPYFDAGGENDGKVFVYPGTSTGLSTSPAWTATGEQVPAWFGISAATAGDVNGDGFSDVLAGSPMGRAYAFYGNNRNGMAVKPSQLRTNGTTPIISLGFSDSMTAMKFQVTGRMPLGREKVKLQWQVAPTGMPLTSTDILSGTSVGWTDVLTTGVAIAETVTGLSPSNSYHWRARLLYQAGNPLGQKAGRWLTDRGNNVTETDFRSRDVAITGHSMGTGNPTILGNANVFTTTVATGTNISYNWAFGDTVIDAGNTVTHTYASAGTYTTTLVTSNNASVITSTATLDVDEPLSGLAASSNSPTALGSATTLTGTVSAGTRPSYSWNFGDGDTGTGGVISHTYSAVGIYTAVVTVTNSVSSITATTNIVVDEAIAGLSTTSSSPTALGTATNLTATVSAGSNIAYDWDFGDGGTGTGVNPSHTYAAQGIYTAIVTATNSVNTLTASTSITVEEPISGLVVTNDSPTLLGSATNLTVTISTGNNVSYAWNYGDGATGTGAANSHTYATTGVFTAIVTATNSVSSIAATGAVTVTDIPISGLSATNNGPTVLGNATALTATISAGTNATYAWGFGDGSSGSGAVASHTYGAAGVYTAIVTATNTANTVTANTTVTVEETITGLAAINYGPTAVGDATTLEASVTTGTGVTYVWDFGDGSAGSGSSVTHSYASAGIYTAIVTATNSVGTATASTEVTVDEAITGLTAASNSPIYLGDTTYFTATVSSGTNIVYDWDFGDGVTDGGEVVGYVYMSTGVYTATISAANSVSAASATTVVTVTDAPITGLSAVSNSPTGLGTATSLTATISGGTNVSYSWDLGDGTTAVDPEVTHTYGSAGYYTAIVTATNSTNVVTATTGITVEQVVSGLVVANNSPTILGNATTLTATISAGTNVTYNWAYGDGATGSGAVNTHTYPAPGVYTTNVTATNSVSSIAATGAVTVTDIPISGLSATNNGPTVLGNASTMTATISAGTSVTYAWAFGDGTTGSGAVASHTYGTAGVYTAIVTATNSVNNLSASTTVTVEAVIAGLSATNNGPTALGSASTLTATVSGGTNISYAWNFGDGTTGSGSAVNHTYASVGVYTAVVTATNSVGTATASTQVTVEEAITGLSVSNNGPTPLGEATTLTATISIGSNVTYSWDYGDGVTGTGAVTSHTYLAMGVYTAVVTATNSLSTQTANGAVSVVDMNISSLSAANNGPTTIGNATILTATISAGSNVTYTWAFGDGDIGAGRVVTHTYAATGVYTAVVTATNSLGSYYANTSVSVNDVATPTPTPTLTPTPILTPTPTSTPSPTPTTTPVPAFKVYLPAALRNYGGGW